MEKGQISSGEQTSDSRVAHRLLDTILDMSLALISGATRCRCVGIRMEKRGDFPLVRSLGFSERFLKRERSLLPEDTGMQFDAENRLALLECLCGKVIRGERFGPGELFTARGSLCLNDFCDTDKIPSNIREEMRTACTEEGFQSFTLVPCCTDGSTLALLMVCDKRRGLISKRLAVKLEEAGEHLVDLVSRLGKLKEVTYPPRRPAIKPARVLVVDDEEEMADLIQKMLETAGHEAMTASGGEEALETLETERFDLVITDLAMPGLSGMELAREIRKRWTPYGPPVILTSGTYSTVTVLSEEQVPGVVAFLPKPFSAEALLEVMQGVLG